MPDKKKLSVITVCYNEKSIASTCDSIVNQSWQDFEWIVIDGGSTDGTLDILEKYRNRIDIFISEKDDGIYHAMNKGIKLARGKYLNFMNGGDAFFGWKTLEKIFANVNHDVDILYGDSLFFREDETPLLKLMPDVIPPYFFEEESLAHQSAIIKRELILAHGLYNESFRIVSDWEKWIDFILIGKAAYMHYPHLVSIHHTNGVSATFDERHQSERKEVTDRLLQYLEKHYPPAPPQEEQVRNITLAYKIKLFGKISLLKVMNNRQKRTKTAYIFNCIPLLKVRY